MTPTIDPTKLADERIDRIERHLRQQANAIYKDQSRSEEWAELVGDADALAALRRSTPPPDVAKLREALWPFVHAYRVHMGDCHGGFDAERQWIAGALVQEDFEQAIAALAPSVDGTWVTRNLPGGGTVLEPPASQDATSVDALPLIDIPKPSPEVAAKLQTMFDDLSTYDPNAVIGGKPTTAVEPGENEDAPSAPPSDGLACYDCGLPYAGEHWVEAVVPNDVWQQISPTGNEGGILCINCMAKELAKLGMNDVPVRLTAGPLTLSAPPSDDVERFTIEDKREQTFDGCSRTHTWHEVRDNGRYLCTCAEREDAEFILAALQAKP